MKNQIYKALAIQYVVSGVFLVVVSVWDSNIVYSGLVGCLTALLPASYVSSRMARKTDAYSAEQWLSFAYRTQLSKWFMTIMIFVLIFTAEYHWHYPILFAGFCFVQITSFTAALMIKGD